jgi:hypothetical protein
MREVAVMAEYSRHNLCPTIENQPRYATLRCTVAHEKTSGCYWRLAAEENDDSYILDYSHKWSDHAGGLDGGTCEKCGKTLKEVRVRINPKTGEPVRKSAISLARAIATTAADVPPIL